MQEILGDFQPSVEGSPWLLAQLAPFLPSAPPCTFEAGNLLTNHVDPFGFSTSASCTGEGPGASRASNATGIVPIKVLGSGSLGRDGQVCNPTATNTHTSSSPATGTGMSLEPLGVRPLPGALLAQP